MTSFLYRSPVLKKLVTLLSFYYIFAMNVLLITNYVNLKKSSHLLTVDLQTVVPISSDSLNDVRKSKLE